MIDKENEPKLIYGHAFDRYLVEVLNQRIMYPHKEIYRFDDDVKWAFRHSKHHPDIALAFSFMIDNILYVPMGATFNSGTSSSNFEPFARASVHLVYFLSSRKDLLVKNRKSLKISNLVNLQIKILFLFK